MLNRESVIQGRKGFDKGHVLIAIGNHKLATVLGQRGEAAVLAESFLEIAATVALLLASSKSFVLHGAWRMRLDEPFFDTLSIIFLHQEERARMTAVNSKDALLLDEKRTALVRLSFAPTPPLLRQALVYPRHIPRCDGHPWHIVAELSSPLHNSRLHFQALWVQM